MICLYYCKAKRQESKQYTQYKKGATMQEKINAYLLETIKQINKLTDLFLSVDLSADDLAALMESKNKAVFDLLKAVNEFGKFYK